MIKVENLDTYGLEHSIRAMRNPKNSWSKSDTYLSDSYEIGYDDKDLMKRLVKAGVEQRTFMRMIYVWCDVTAPLYWWKEMDRYTIGKSQISTSTMHKIHDKKITLKDFSHEHLLDKWDIYNEIGCNIRIGTPADLLEDTIGTLNHFRDLYLKTKDKKYWWQMIQLLPSSYNQKRTLCLSYETILKIIKERENHKLDEWKELVNIFKKQLPLIEEFSKELGKQKKK